MCMMDCSGGRLVITTEQSDIPFDTTTEEILIQEVNPETSTGDTEEAVQPPAIESVKEENDTGSVKETSSVAEGATDNGNAEEMSVVPAE